jgi:lipopolysaccharide transport system ATP-binding protein
MSSKSKTTLPLVVRGLGKKYTIAHNSMKATSFGEALIQRFRDPFGSQRQVHEAFWALQDVSFEIEPGEVVGIIGRNGAGKSTLLKLLTRITGPTAGTIDIRGRAASLLEVGTGFHPELTGRENVFLNGSILGMSRREIIAKFDEIVEFAEVEQFLDTPVKRYSSGMYVRLAFAVAAHLDPDILIVDEVLAVGDSAFQRKCLGKLQDVTASGDRVVLFVSHNLTTIRSLCNRVIWLKGGRVKWDGEVGPAIEEFLTENLGGGANRFELDAAPRKHLHETPVRITNVILNDGGVIRHGEPLTIEIQYRCIRATGDVAFGFEFASPDGGRVMNVDSDNPGGRRFAIPSQSEGRVVLTVEENLLQPTRYFVSVTAHSGYHHSLDSLVTFGQVEVLDGPKTPPCLVGRNDQGCVRTPCTLRHESEIITSDGHVRSTAPGNLAVL